MATVLGAVVPMVGESSLLGTAAIILVYDMVAFCLQLPLGALMDRLPSGRTAAIFSLGLVAVGVTLGRIGIGLAAVLAVALGNALFHCAGGVDVLDLGLDTAAPSGCFIATGAMGVFLGSLPAVNGWDMLMEVLLALLLICGGLIARLHPAGPESAGRAPIDAVALVLLAATVALRSYAGMCMAFPWKSAFPLAVASILAVVAGKAAGGFIADRRSMMVAAIVSLGGAAVLFPFSWTMPAAGLAAVFLFNFTMPVTLVSMARLMPAERGMAFGICSASLAIGSLPALMGVRAASPMGLAVLSLVSLAALAAGLLRMGGDAR